MADLTKDNKIWPMIWSLFASEVNHTLMTQDVAALSGLASRTEDEEKRLADWQATLINDLKVMDKWKTLLNKAGYDWKSKEIMEYRPVVLETLAEERVAKIAVEQEMQKTNLYTQVMNLSISKAEYSKEDLATIKDLIAKAESKENVGELDNYQKAVTSLLSQNCIWLGIK